MKKSIFVFLVILFLIFLLRIDNVSASRHEYNNYKLNDFFGKSYCSNEADCRDNPEYKFYLKMYDLYYLYRIKYNVKLDLSLIMATLSYDNDENFFKKNLSDYDRKSIVESNWNPSGVTELDWDYDYESKDNYLVSNDSSLDMQVLAKNMVSKTTLQKCVKDGQTIRSEKIKDSDVDLNCGEGETLEKGTSTYELDTDKYDKFMREYLEKKFFLNRVTSNPTDSLGPTYVNRDKYPNVKKKTTSSSSSSSSSSHEVSVSGIEVIDKLNEIALGEEGNSGEKYYNFMGSSYRIEWCASFISWLFNQVDGTNKYLIPATGAGSIPRSSVPAGLGVWLEDECYDSSTVPRAGDIILFDPFIGNYTVPWPDNGNDQYYSSHIGYVYKVDDENVYTVEGNSGDMVKVKSYSRKKCGSGFIQGINGYYRPNY